ncbi:bifunctional diguanylate cyclase/phosphodiesterase [Arabiibacter massiliensis]|uniref:bifunctional diguanylate cyclase/phosphodiesterase n=1 Tax=Arabiibacter massiliensis TaxID=1870985 RepID=UPI0009BC21D2|nr:sensor domain-containing phosphodiesterase [Arabiibacter massiliensis]
MRGMLNSLLSGLSELVYICDVDTYELLFLNEPGLRLFGEDAVENAEPCYRVLQGRDEPCPFCTNDLLDFDTFYEWEHTNERMRRHYLLRDKLVQWRGRTARLEIAFDVTDRERQRESYKFLAEAGDMALECIKVLDGDRTLEFAIDETLRILGGFLEADRTYVFCIDDESGGTLSNYFEWCAPGVESQKRNLQHMTIDFIEAWLEPFSAGRAMIIGDVGGLEGNRSEEREALAVQDIRSLVAAPLEVDGRFVGFLGADNPGRGGLDSISSPLMGLAYFLSASMKRVATQRMVDQLTWNDPLTHARSRAAFHRDFDRGLFEDIGFVLVDADRLNVINREQGRPMGDEVLRRIAACLGEVFGDHVYRIGDDEFCAVASPIGYAEFAVLAERAAQRFLDEGLPASLGPAWKARCTTTVSLLDSAGDRMRSAKRGRHRAVDLGVDLASDAAVSSLLRPGGAQEAARAGLLDIFLMPQTSCEDGSLVGAEALIRYHDRVRGMQALPSSFIPALEDMGEISAIDFFALGRACATVARWQREGRAPVPLAVNFSRRTIGDARFVERVASTVAEHGVDAGLIEIEITESAREEDDALLRYVADGLRERGFRVAIDDFGVENANFSLFIQLEFDVLKMDKSLVWGLGVEERTMQVIRSLADLCRDLGIETVAEGIENEEQYAALREAGCTRAQGYLVGKPQPIKEFERTFMA